MSNVSQLAQEVRELREQVLALRSAKIDGIPLETKIQLILTDIIRQEVRAEVRKLFSQKGLERIEFEAKDVYEVNKRIERLYKMIMEIKETR